MVSRYSRAIKTGLGSVVITKFAKVSKCGRRLGSRGALAKFHVRFIRTISKEKSSYYEDAGSVKDFLSKPQSQTL